MKIVSLNTWRGACRENLAEFIRLHKDDTDIFLFQEASGETEVLRRELLKELQALSTSKDEYTTGDELYQTTIYRQGIELIAGGTFFTQHKDQGLGLWTEFLVAGERLIVCNIHGGAFPGDKEDTEYRIAQTQEILDFLQTKKGKHIVMGDFNLNPATKSITLFEETGYRNLIKLYQIETTRNEIAWASYPDNKQLWADYAFVGTDVEVKNFAVPKNAVSDHLPMILEFD
jgi:endonuclease/exonuclease/phosphatase family metal-dependent hydrolase